MQDSLNELLEEYKSNEDIDYSYDNLVVKQINQSILSLDDTHQISDGNHTFGELYYHRMKMFSFICKLYPDLAWKSRIHSDGYELRDSFIVGIETPEGQFTYHYPIESWKEFKVKVYNVAPEFDGHTSDDIVRLFSLLEQT